MRTLDHASLTPAERRTLQRLVAALAQRWGEDLRSVWLYGSRARGEYTHVESDVDVLLVVRGATMLGTVGEILELAYPIAAEEGAQAAFFSFQSHDPSWVEDRRRIESFYLREVDRDKIVVYGEP